MSRRMLIDATQAEETRVVLLSGNHVEDFDFETESRKQLKGNIYLARVTRVEPSLQAAFVEYGGNRHGFLAFSEIHPDYYRIPVEDREALLAEEQEENAVPAETMAEAADNGEAVTGSNDDPGPDEAPRAEDGSGESGPDENGSAENAPAGNTENDDSHDAGPPPESIGGDDTDDTEEARPRKALSRRYKIQEVVTRRQIMLVQVVKEERGNKGAALTTYLSLAGRYCVLMPNTARGGGVSRKITNMADRKRLKQVVEALDVPEGMAVIVRTAGSQRTRTEIKRDYEYLLRLWNQIREKTLTSSAPCLIHEEANLIKRSIRDLYTSDIGEVLVEGEDGYRIAKDFMRTLVPSHAKRVQPYREQTVPLFHRYQIEGQLDAIHNPVVQLRSGGYLVMSQTEALVAIDVNSGRATRERNIEETALRTNLEAADEVARQLRLRDMAGLVVIDFIDMDESRNQHAVERRMKEAMKSDRARIQLGRISHFGLMELSRQRLRPSVFEASTRVCEQCSGSGRVRSTDSTALHVLRAVEEEGIRQKTREIAVHVPSGVGFYILNRKREALATIEERYGFRVFLEADDSLVPPDMRIERLLPKPASERLDLAAPIITPPEIAGDEEDGEEREDERRPRRPRRRRRGGDRRQTEQQEQAENASEEAVEGEEESTAEGEGNIPGSEDDEGGRKRRRRGKRGGRRRSRRNGEEGNGAETVASPENGPEDGNKDSATEESAAPDIQIPSDTEAAIPAPAGNSDPASGDEASTADVSAEATGTEAEDISAEKPKAKRKPRPRRKKTPDTEGMATEETATEVPDSAAGEAEAPKPRRRRSRKSPATAEAATGSGAETETPEAAAGQPASPETETSAPAGEQAPAEASPESDPAPQPAPSMQESIPAPEGNADIAASPPVETADEMPVASREFSPANDGSSNDDAGVAPANDSAANDSMAGPDGGSSVVNVDEVIADAPESKPRRGWWNRLISS